MPEIAGLRLHHVGYAVKQIEAIAKSYTERFGYDVSTDIIHDPLQTALVQFLRLPGDTSYLEFVAPDGPDSKLALAAERKGGLNHLCFTSGPFDTVLPALEDAGMLQISEIEPGVAFRGRRLCWLVGSDPLPIELVERRSDDDLCAPGL